MVLAHNIDDGNRTQDIQICQGITFESMLLASNTLQGLRNSGFEKPSPIQLHSIPLGKCGFDLLLEAKSGTGKTAVFTIIALEQLELTKGLQAIILAPTREIAAQICDVINQLGCNFEGLKVEVVMGGLPVQADIEKFEYNDVHILVGSPGRTRHLIQGKHINTSAVRLLVLDEADKLLEKSFLADINYIFSILPQQKQVIMSSATYPTETKDLIQKYVQSAQHICPDSNSILIGITQKVTIVQHSNNIVKQTTYRFEELLKILSKNAFKQCLIFCNYQVRVGELHKMLKKHKWPAEQLYGQQEQLQRLGALKSLQEYKCRILISTDLTARGIDASNVDLVVNFEPPYEWQTYLHRIGRAGRFGSYGTAITILSKGREEKTFGDILQTVKVPLILTTAQDEESPFTIDDEGETSTTSQQTEITTASKLVKTTECEKLWGILISDVSKVSNDLDNFENLYNSYNSVQDKIDSFTDLLNSLDDHELINGSNISYQHLNIPSMHIPEYIKNNPTTNESKLNLKTMIISDNQSRNKKENCAEHKKHYNYCKDRTNICHRMKSEGSEYECDNTTQALLNAGLPTAFGKPKITGIEAKLKYSRNFTYNNNILYDENTKKINKNRLSYQDTEDSDTSQGFYNVRKEKVHTKSKYHRKPARKSGYEVDDENYDNFNNISNNPYSRQTNTGSYSRNASSSEIGTEVFNNTDNSDQGHYSLANLNYLKWYNTLKFRTKAVENFIYIEEMSKPVT